MLEYYAHTHDEAFAKRVLLPTIAAVLTFFAEHYGPEAYAGQLVLTPSQALETWQNCVNPAQDVSSTTIALCHLSATRTVSLLSDQHVTRNRSQA